MFYFVRLISMVYVVVEAGTSVRRCMIYIYMYFFEIETGGF